jgi:hypothetical protein
MDAAVAPVSPPQAPVALGRLLLSRLDAEASAAIVAAVSDEVRQEVHEQAVVEARSELEAEFESRRVALGDRLARERQQIEADCEARLEVEVAREVEAIRLDLEDRAADLHDQRTQARQARDEVTDLLLGLVR